MSTRPRTAPPPLPSVTVAQHQQQARLLRVGALLALLAVFVVPHVPSPIRGFDWWAAVRPTLTILDVQLPPAPLDLGLLTIVPHPLLQWGIWALAAFLGVLALSLVLHLCALYAQRTRPLGVPRTYLRLLVPARAAGKPGTVVPLLSALHGMLPSPTPRQPAPTPLLLCWTAQPEQKVQQGVSIAGPPACVTSVQKHLLGIASGTTANAIADPLLTALRPGRLLCVAEARLVLGDDVPIAVVGATPTLLRGLLPALAPQGGVVAASVRLALAPIPDRRWRLAVLTLGERRTAEVGPTERQALTAKAAGPAFRCRLLLLAVAEDAAAGTAQVQTLASALAASAQAVGLRSQRLQAGSVQVLPAVVAPPPPLAIARRAGGVLVGVLLAALLTHLLWRVGLVSPLGWALPFLVLPLPLLVLAAHQRACTDAALVQRHAALLEGLLPPRNPRLVPIWWPWLGHRDAGDAP